MYYVIQGHLTAGDSTERGEEDRQKLHKIFKRNTPKTIISIIFHLIDM